MSEYFRQINVSPNLSYFKEFFKKKWDLKDYHNVNEPSIFFGLYTQKEIEKFKKHKGKKMIIWGGADQNLSKFQSIKNTPEELEQATREMISRTKGNYLQEPDDDLQIRFKSLAEECGSQYGDYSAKAFAPISREFIHKNFDLLD